MPIVVPNDRRTSLATPGPTTRRDEHEAALIEEDDVGAKSSGFFLWRATCGASSGRWPLRRAGSRVVPEPDSSSHRIGGLARDGWDGTEHRIPCGSGSRSASRSRARWETHTPSPPEAAASRVSAVAGPSASGDGLARASNPIHGFPLSSRSVPSGELTKPKTGRVVRPRSRSDLASIAPSHVDGASPNSMQIHGVSFLIASHLSITYANLNK